jgi:hypothetical protein
VKGSPGIDVQFGDAAQTIREAKEVRATVLYYVDDFEINA